MSGVWGRRIFRYRRQRGLNEGDQQHVMQLSIAITCLSFTTALTTCIPLRRFNILSDVVVLHKSMCHIALCDNKIILTCDIDNQMWIYSLRNGFRIESILYYILFLISGEKYLLLAFQIVCDFIWTYLIFNASFHCIYVANLILLASALSIHDKIKRREQLCASEKNRWCRS